MEEKLDLLFEEIKNECIKIIEDRNIDIDELSHEMGCDAKTLLKFLEKREADFSVYLKLYDILIEW